MKISETLNDYRSHNPKSYDQHKAKIEAYMEIVEDMEIPDALDEAFLRDYILFKDDKKAKGKYDALVSYNLFVNTFYFNTPKSKVVFPIKKYDVVEFDKENNINSNRGSGRSQVVYLDETYELTKLFDDKYYEHIKCQNAIKTIKAVIALALGAGYNTAELFTSRKIKISDLQFVDDKVKVTNFYKTDEKSITIAGKLAGVIVDYYAIRKNYIVTSSHDKQDDFIVKMWDTDDINYDPDIKTHKNAKPYNVQHLVYYFLKFISRETGIEGELSITDIRFNMVLHKLYHTKGAALKDIIRSFGLIEFVQDAIMEYLSTEDSFSEYMFTAKDFFESTPSEEAGDNMSDGGNKRKELLLCRLERDSRIIRALKSKYNNCCQICGDTMTLLENIRYSEACHIQPIGGKHNGPDIESNILILCPNHHKLLDLGVICIDPDYPDRILHIDSTNSLNSAKLKLSKHKVASSFVQYHYENIFLNRLC